MNESVSLISSLIIFLFPFVGRFRFDRNLLASTVVSLGLLGTFGGILLGLLDFDATNIEMALPTLIEGLKTAFLTSIAGMVSSLILKLCPAFYLIRMEKTTPHEEQQADQMIGLLADIKNCLEQGKQDSASELRQLQADNNENIARLCEQFGNFPAEINGNIQTLIKAFEDSGLNTPGRDSTTLSELSTSINALVGKQTDDVTRISGTCTHLLETTETIQASITQLCETMSQSVAQAKEFISSHGKDISHQYQNFGTLVKDSEHNLQQQISAMEVRFEQELSAMEKFSRTLLSIVRKLNQDQNVLGKQYEEEEETGKEN